MGRKKDRQEVVRAALAACRCIAVGIGDGDAGGGAGKVSSLG